MFHCISSWVNRVTVCKYFHLTGKSLSKCTGFTLKTILTYHSQLFIFPYSFISLGQGSWSYLGTDATRVPKESFTMNLGFVDRPTVLHEFGHSLGLIHEHQSPFPGGFKWNRENVRSILPTTARFLPLLCFFCC